MSTSRVVSPAAAEAQAEAGAPLSEKQRAQADLIACERGVPHTQQLPTTQYRRNSPRLYGPVIHPDDLPLVEAALRADAAIAASAEGTDYGKVTTKEKGVTGLDARSGRIYQEYSTRLQTLSTRLTAYEEMRRSDSAIAAMEALVTLPILQTQFRVLPGDDTAFGEFVEWNLQEGLSHDFRQTLRTAIMAVLYGFSWHHKVFEQKPTQGYMGWRKFAERERSTVKEWRFDKEGGLAGLLQYGRDPNTGEMKEIEYGVPEIIVWTWRPEGNNPEGLGALRQAYKHWYYKQALEEFAAIRIERQACGVPIAIGPPEGYDETERDEVLAQLQNLRTAHDGAMVVPYGWELKLLELGDAGVPFEQHIDRQHQAILQTVNAQFLGTGGDSGTAGYMNRDAGNLFLMSLEAIADWICWTFNLYAIPQLAAYNGVDAEKLPKLGHGRVGVRDIERFTRAISYVFDDGVQMPQSVLEYVCEELGLPEFDPGEIPTASTDGTAGEGDGGAAEGTGGEGDGAGDGSNGGADSSSNGGEE